MPSALILNDDEYASSEDSDFAPDAGPPPGEDGQTSEEDSDLDEPNVKAPTGKRKRLEVVDEAEDLGIENSGDEAIITQAKKKKKRTKKAKGGDEEDEDEGGEGGLIKTRSMRAAEQIGKKPLADTSAATIDVDAVWEAMLSGKPLPSTDSKPDAQSTKGSPTRSLSPEAKRLDTIQLTRKDARSSSTTLSDGPNAMILIKRSYKFAGKVHTEQKLVPRNSAEAKLYLASQPEATAERETLPAPEFFSKPKRPLKLARRSIFEPIVEGIPQRTDLYFGSRKESGITLIGVTGKEKKLNTVEKSAMDWAGFVDKEGIADELDAAGKSKGAYKSRQEFLARVEQKKEEEARRARGLPV